MATEVYQPPQDLKATTVVYGLDTGNGTEVYEDPNDTLFAGEIQIAGQVPTVVVA